MAFSAGQVLTAAQLNDFAPGTRVQVGDGSAAAPSITSTNDLDSGIYFGGTNVVNVSVGGARTAYFDDMLSNSALRLLGDGTTVRYLYLQQQVSSPTGTQGDSGILFGDNDDTSQAGFYWDESAKQLFLRGYNNSTTITLDADQGLFENGTVSLPSISFVNDANSGFYITGNNGRIDWSGNGVKGGHLNASGVYVVDGTEASPSYSFINATNYGMRQTGTVLRMVTAGADRLEIDSASVSAVDNNSLALGNSVQRWTTVYSVNADDISSDMRLKERTGEPLGLDFVQRLDPFEGTWLDGSDNGRRHQWLSAQNVAEALTDEGIDPHRSTLWRDTDAGQSLAYTELIPVLVRAVQELADRVDA